SLLVLLTVGHHLHNLHRNTSKLASHRAEVYKLDNVPQIIEKFKFGAILVQIHRPKPAHAATVWKHWRVQPILESISKLNLSKLHIRCKLFTFPKPLIAVVHSHINGS